MENYTQEDDSAAHLLSDDERFERWTQQHSELKRQIEAIELKPYVTEADRTEEQRLKKLKLQIKDQMNAMLIPRTRSASA